MTEHGCCARQDSHPRPSRSKRAALICCTTGAEEIRPRAMELLLTPPNLGGLPLIRDDGPALHVTCVVPTRVWAKMLVLRTVVSCAGKIGVARPPGGNRTTIYWRYFIPMRSARERARRRVPGSFPWLHRNQVNARSCICIHRRKCHLSRRGRAELPDGLAGSSYEAGRRR